MKNANYITLWLNDTPFVTILENYKTFEQAARKARQYCNNTGGKLTFTINTPLTRKLNSKN